jgi:hypothetical protein
MQVTSDKIILLLAGLIILPQVYGQIEITNMDSLPLLKPDAMRICTISRTMRLKRLNSGRILMHLLKLT